MDLGPLQGSSTMVLPVLLAVPAPGCNCKRSGYVLPLILVVSWREKPLINDRTTQDSLNSPGGIFSLLLRLPPYSHPPIAEEAAIAECREQTPRVR